jgi:hypothetical protein
MKHNLLVSASVLLLAFNIAPAVADNNSTGCQGNCQTTTGTPSTFNVDPVISPTVVGPTTTVAPVIAPTTVVAPVIAPKIEVGNTNLNANSVRNDVGVGVGVDVRNTTANAVVVSPDQRNANAVTVSPTIAPRQDQSQGQTQGQTQNQTATATSNQTQSVNNGQTVAPQQSMTYNEAALPADTKVTVRSVPNVQAPALAAAINNDL